MRLFIHQCQIEDIKFYEHSYRINPRSISREERLRMRQNNLKNFGASILPWCGYADDLILFLLNQTDLQRATSLLNELFTRYGLAINTLKTESMILNYSESHYPESIVNIENVPLNNVKSFKYLCAFIRFDQPNTGDVEVNHRIQMAVSKFAEMSNLIQNVSTNLRT